MPSSVVPAAASTSSVSATIGAYRAAGEHRDADAVSLLLAPDVVLNSPLTARVRFEGRDEVTAMHRDIFAVLEGLQTGEPLARDDTRAFTFRARVRGVELNAVVLVEFNEDAQIADITLFSRPLPATATLFSSLPPRVAARRRGPAIGAFVTAVTRPIAFVLHNVDRLVPRVL
jgi:hypothetical protein